MTNSDVKKIIDFIKDYFQKNSWAKGAVIGMSGGKDSLIVAKLCVEALGKDRVLGVIMPNGQMTDLSDAIDSCKLLGIDYNIVDISKSYNEILSSAKTVLDDKHIPLNSVTSINIAPRVRTATLYAIGASMDYLVANTSNLSEAMVGYTTKWGDNVGDFGVIANFTKSEVCEIGLLLGLPERLVHKVPSDGLSGKSDEEKLGFAYKNLDEFIRQGKLSFDHDKILRMHKNSEHKRIGVIKYSNNLPNHFEG